MTRKRWTLEVMDITGNVIHQQAFRTRYFAMRQGFLITNPPLNFPRVRRTR